MSQIRVRRDSCVIIGGMDKIVAFDQSQNMDDLKALPDANKVATDGENKVVTWRSKFRRDLSDFNAKRGFVVRSEGGRICCDFNDLRKWAKSLGAFPACRCFFQRVGRAPQLESACGTSPCSVTFNYT